MPDDDVRSALRRRAEAVALDHAPHALDHLQPQRALHELRVHQIELEMQNEELRRAHEELEASRAKYVDLYDMAPVGYFTLGEPGLILEANLTAARLLGVARGALVKQPLSRLYPPRGPGHPLPSPPAALRNGRAADVGVAAAEKGLRPLLGAGAGDHGARRRRGGDMARSDQRRGRPQACRGGERRRPNSKSRTSNS